MNGDEDFELYLRLFKGREDYFAEQVQDGYFPVNRPFDEFYLRQHLEGDATYGLYVLDRNSRCHLLCVDVDIPKADIGGVNIADPISKYGYLRDKLQAILETLHLKLGVPPDSILLEETGGRGYHVWVFLTDPLDGKAAFRFGQVLKKHLDFDVEFFPKQGTLAGEHSLGNLIKLPLGLHRKYGSPSVFFSPCEDGPRLIDGLKANLEHLASIAPVEPRSIAQPVEAFGPVTTVPDYARPDAVSGGAPRARFEGEPTTLLARCQALRNLRAKAARGEPLTRSEAFHFANAMLSVPGGVDCVHETIRLSFAQKYDRQRTQEEIEKIDPLHATSCSTLVGLSICPDYCKESVRRRNEDPLAPNTTPCGVWLQPSRRKRAAVRENLLAMLATADNVKRAFFQLKRYHEHEALLFFDPFDFGHFEKNLDANCEVIAKALRQGTEIAFSGYLPVHLPKKLNENLGLEYRTMSHSSVYDQGPIQAVFNFVAPVMEEEFQESSYGYRWNRDSGEPSAIFEDWRRAYPRFRNAIMAALRRNPNGYHVCCDIRGYYDHVDHRILLEQIRGLVSDKYACRLIEGAVRSYESEEGGEKGLPQGPAYARVLANLYLNDLDVSAARITADYFRYVDDLVLVFESKDDAEEGLKRLTRYLLDLGLELSQDEAKKPTIEPNTDATRVRKTLEKIQYGILEGTRHLPHLTPHAVADFWDAVERHSVSPVNLDQLIEINDSLPSILYEVTQDPIFPHPLRGKVGDIVVFLIRHRWFCPKRLKSVFYYVLQLGRADGDLRELFKAMDPAHKPYFILSVFARWKVRGEYHELLKDLVAIALTEADSFVRGFAIAIASELGIEMDAADQLERLREGLSRKDSLFALIKWVGTVGYDSLGSEQRAQVRELVGSASPDLIKMVLLSQLSELPTAYIDGIYLRGILKDSGVLLLPPVCALLAAATDATDAFYGLIDFGLRRLTFKPLFISTVTKELFGRRASAGLAETENLKMVYAKVPDEELRNAMLNALSRITSYGPAYGTEFAKLHKQIHCYNECFLFESTAPGASYAYLELIPESRLREYMPRDLDSAREVIADFSSKAILLPCTFVYSSENSEIRLEYTNQQGLRELDKKAFSREPSAFRLALQLAAQAYKKALYFRRKTGKVPPVSPDNLLVDITTNNLVFRTFGRCLSTSHVFGGRAVGDEESDIAEMVSFLLTELLFDSGTEARQFLDQKHHKGLDAFLRQCIQNMSGKEPASRYSCSRFAYLVEQFTEPANLSEQQICVLYLRERLKGALFRYNADKVTWAGICRAVNEHVSEHLPMVCDRHVLEDAPFRNLLRLAGRGKRGLHTLSRQLLNLAFNRKHLLDVTYADDPYCDLVEFLLLYCTACVETVSLVRALDDRRALRSLLAGPLRPGERIRVEAGGLGADFAYADLGALLICEPKEKMHEAIMGSSLRELALQSLLASGAIVAHEHSLRAEKPEKMSDEVFRRLAHACLIRIPHVERSAEAVLNSVFSALYSNEDFARPGSLSETREAVEILADDLKRIRRPLGIRRRHGRAFGGYFPPDIPCTTSFGGKTIAKEEALPGFGLTNSIPSNRNGYACSWDLRGTSIVSLVIPSEGVNSLIVGLSRGKFFGYKFRYLYSGKALLIWDVALFIAGGTALALSTLAAASATCGVAVKGMSAVGTWLFGSLCAFLAGKVLLFDLAYWTGSHKRFMRAVREFFTPSAPSS